MNPNAGQNPLFQPVMTPNPSGVPSGAQIPAGTTRATPPGSSQSSTRESPASFHPATRGSPGLLSGAGAMQQSSLLSSGTDVYSGGGASLIQPPAMTSSRQTP